METTRKKALFCRSFEGYYIRNTVLVYYKNVIHLNETCFNFLMFMLFFLIGKLKGSLTSGTPCYIFISAIINDNFA